MKPDGKSLFCAGKGGLWKDEYEKGGCETREEQCFFLHTFDSFLFMIMTGGGSLMKTVKKVGLALGAGAARGFAHIGVLKVFEEEGIPVDVITGTSMGALVGGLYAAGTPVKYLEAYSDKLEISKYLDFSVSKAGLVKGRRIELLLKVLTGNKSIGQLKIPYACAAIDVKTGEVAVFKDGGLLRSHPGQHFHARRVRALRNRGSVLYGRRPLCRVPSGAARELGADVVIGVDVSWRGQEKRVPTNPLSALQAALSITGWEIAKGRENEADLLITPDVHKVNPFSQKEAEICIAEGEKSAREALGK